MANLGAFLQRRALWVGFVAVLVPLLVLLALQSVWLSRLERASVLAHQAALNNYLEAIGTEIEYTYSSIAERALNLPASLFTEGSLEKAAHFWRKKSVEGVRRLFLVDFTREPFGNYLFYDSSRDVLVTPPASDEAAAVIAATIPWQMLSYHRAPADSPGITVDERNPDYRIILNPITDERSRVVGVAGMIVDEGYFKNELLPSILKRTIPAFFPGTADEPVLAVRDAKGEVVVGSAVREHEASRPLSFVFGDWTLRVHSPGSDVERWDHASFAFNMTLSVLLGAALLAGIGLALWSANRVLRLSEMKSEFVSNMSHELRTPLASIRVFAEMLRAGKVQSPEKIQEYGDYIEAESRRLSRLINNILDFSRIESGRKTYRFVRTNLSEVVTATLRSFEVRVRHRGFAIAFHGPEASLPPLEIDSDAIEQAFHNLLDNAVKYSGDSRQITVRLARQEDFAVLSVQDRGIGIPRDEHGKIFDRFHRVGTGLVHDVKGTGLGLSIVHHIVKAHGGRVTLESEPGLGSTFSVWLPVTPGGAVEVPRAGDAVPEASALGPRVS